MSGVPVLEGGQRELSRRSPSGLALGGTSPGSSHPGRLEVVGLAEGGRQELPAVLRIQQPAGHARRSPGWHRSCGPRRRSGWCGTAPPGSGPAARCRTPAGRSGCGRARTGTAAAARASACADRRRRVALEHQAGVEARDRQGARGRARQLPGARSSSSYWVPRQAMPGRRK